MSRRQLLTAAGVVGLSGCLGGGAGGAGDAAGSGGTGDSSVATAATPTDSGPGPTWRERQLTDVRNGEEFTIAGFAGTPVVLEFFAVWCPICTDQQEQIAALHESMDGFVSVSLNTDPNEDAAKVRQHLDRHGFDWRYAIAPAEMTNQLVEQFGTAIANPPSAPVVVVCGDGQARRLPNGVTPPEELRSAIESGC